MLLLHDACSRFALASRKKGVAAPRPDRCDGRPDGRRKRVYDKVRASDSGTACFLVCLFWHWARFSKTLFSLEGRNNRATDGCLGSLKDGSSSIDPQKKIYNYTHWHTECLCAYQGCFGNGQKRGVRFGTKNEELVVGTNARSSRIMSSPGDSDSLSGQFWPAPVVPIHG